MVRRYFGAYGATHYGYFGKRPRPLGPWEAALRVQAAARGFLARRMVRKVRAVEQEGEAALRVQAAARGFLARRMVRKVRDVEAALRVQAAARGFLARRMVRKVRDVEKEAEGVAARLAALQQASRGGDASVTAAEAEAEEELMQLLLRLNAVRGARAYRRRVVARVITLQDVLDGVGGSADA